MARLNAGMRGHPIFFENGGVRGDLTRAGQYARLLASVGINGCTINNVNADLRILDDSFHSTTGAHRGCFSSLGSAAGGVGRSEQPEDGGRSGHF